MTGSGAMTTSAIIRVISGKSSKALRSHPAMPPDRGEEFGGGLPDFKHEGIDGRFEDGELATDGGLARAGEKDDARRHRAEVTRGKYQECKTMMDRSDSCCRELVT